jgi:hypothetical protein
MFAWYNKYLDSKNAPITTVYLTAAIFDFNAGHCILCEKRFAKNIVQS